MPPKKAAVQEKVLLGRPGNNLKSGIVCEQDPTKLLIFSSAPPSLLLFSYISALPPKKFPFSFQQLCQFS